MLKDYLFYFLSRFGKGFAVKRALDYGLYEVILPRAKNEEGKTLKDALASMEQFFSGMLSCRSYFVLEMASPATENETDFYVSVPRDQFSIFERQVHSIFPHAEIREEKTDYNIFKYKGVSVGAAMKFREHASLPIKTYEKITVSPLEVLANTFSGFDKNNEGAALQIVVSTEENDFKKKVLRIMELMRQGEPFRIAVENASKSFLRSLFSVLTGGSAHPDKKPAENFGLSKQKEIMAEMLNEKISRRIIRANIRLVASARTKEHAQKILNEMKTAFSPYAEPQGNSFVVAEYGGRTLRNFLHDFSFRLFSSSSSVYLNLAELVSLFYFPVVEISAPKVKFLKIKRTMAPSNIPAEGLLLGKNIFRDKPVEIRMKTDDRRRHLYTIGQTGTGKSVLMENMIVQDILEGRGLCFIDPHGGSVEKILGQIPPDRWEDVIYFDPGNVSSPPGLNMLEYDPNHPEHKTLIVNELIEIFNKLYNMSIAGGPMFEQYFRNAAILVMDDPLSGSTLLEISRVLSDKDFRHYKLSKSTNESVKNFWIQQAEKAGGEAALQNMVPYVTSKMDAFLTNEIMRPILCQEHSSFNFRDVMDNGKILLINLSKGRLGETNAYLLGMILVGRLFMAAMSRADIPEEKRRDFYFYIDEFQNVTTKSIASILSEARKYRLSLVIAHQFIGQLEEDIKKAIFGNVGSMAIFRVGSEDAEFLAKYLAPVFTAEDLITVPNYNTYAKLLIDGQTSLPFNIETLAPAESNPDTERKVKELSQIKYGRRLGEIEHEIGQRFLKSLPKEEPV